PVRRQRVNVALVVRSRMIYQRVLFEVQDRQRDQQKEKKAEEKSNRFSRSRSVGGRIMHRAARKRSVRRDANPLIANDRQPKSNRRRDEPNDLPPKRQLHAAAPPNVPAPRDNVHRSNASSPFARHTSDRAPRFAFPHAQAVAPASQPHSFQPAQHRGPWL